MLASPTPGALNVHLPSSSKLSVVGLCPWPFLAACMGGLRSAAEPLLGFGASDVFIYPSNVPQAHFVPSLFQEPPCRPVRVEGHFLASREHGQMNECLLAPEKQPFPKQPSHLPLTLHTFTISTVAPTPAPLRGAFSCSGLSGEVL